MKPEASFGAIGPKSESSVSAGTFKIVLSDGTVVLRDNSPMAVVVKTGQPVLSIEAYAEHPDGTRIPCARFPTSMLMKTGKVIGGVNMLVDISQQKTIQ